MHLLITGGTGFIGSALIQSLLSEGNRLTIFSRQTLVDTATCEYVQSLERIAENAHFDAVVNLAGESLANKRWSKAYKQKIVASRLTTTATLIALLNRLPHKPEVLLNASAVGYYGHQGEVELSEDAEVVPGFAQDLCQRWETLACGAQDCGIRVCRLRFGVVLDRKGGAMDQMGAPFRLGIANWLGQGTQWLSWIHRQDVIRAIQFLLERHELSGAFNITAPQPVTSRGFCEVMKRHQRTFITVPIPAFALRLLVGEMAVELLLNGQCVVPTALHRAGFTFLFPELDTALEDILK